MGCTNSTTNMPESQSSTTDDKENTMPSEISREPIEENNIIYSNSKELDQRQVLPESKFTNECKFSKRQTKIASEENVKSTVDVLDIDNKDVEDTTPTNNHSDTLNASDTAPLRDNFISLKVVVEKVISDNADEVQQINNLTETRNEDLDRPIEKNISDSNISEGDEIELNEHEAKESPSPSQSEDSPATRWEALADIAAELPPSLAVDPLTGQIYSLTK